MQSLPSIDLHMHSTFSDGTDTPAQLLKTVKAAGLGCFALTDHDAIAGCVELQGLLAPGDPQFIPGIEFSCKDELGKYHVLGYRYDPASPAIRDVLALGHGYRMKKLGLRLDYLRAEYGFVFPEEDLEALYAQPNPGKPHIANLMVKHGYAKTKNQAFADYLNRLHAEDDYVRPEEAIRGILGAGGVPVLAHPCYGDGDQIILGDELEQRVVRLEAFGLQGLEGYYSGFSKPLRELVLSLAERYGLYVTAGSDYHGTNKLVSLGDTGIKESAAPAEGILRFWEAVTT